MKIVIDASAAFIMLGAPDRVAPFFVDATDVLAPELIVAEMLNARWKITRAGLPGPSLAVVFGLLDRVRLVATRAYASAAAELAARLDHPVYDCLYAVVAEREQAQLLTADRRFSKKLVNEAIAVVTI